MRRRDSQGVKTIDSMASRPYCDRNAARASDQSAARDGVGRGGESDGRSDVSTAAGGVGPSSARGPFQRHVPGRHCGARPRARAMPAPDPAPSARLALCGSNAIALLGRRVHGRVLAIL